MSEMVRAYVSVTGLAALLFAGALALTLAIEIPVAALFRVGRRGLAAVAWINVITNPVYNLALVLVVLATGFGFGQGAVATLSVPVLEVVVVLVEWRMLVWALHGTAGSSRKMLALSVTMNVASALAGVLIVALWFGLPAQDPQIAERESWRPSADATRTAAPCGTSRETATNLRTDAPVRFYLVRPGANWFRLDPRAQAIGTANGDGVAFSVYLVSSGRWKALLYNASADGVDDPFSAPGEHPSAMSSLMDFEGASSTDTPAPFRNGASPKWLMIVAKTRDNRPGAIGLVVKSQGVERAIAR